MMDFLNPPHVKTVLKLPVPEGSWLADHYPLSERQWALVYETGDTGKIPFIVNLEDFSYLQIITGIGE